MKNPIKFATIFLSLTFLFCMIMPILGQHQIEIDSVKGPGRDAVIIKYAERDGVRVSGAGRAGFLSENAGDGFIASLSQTGFTVFGAQWNGLFVQDAGNNGVHVSQTGNHGVFIGNAGSEGVYISNAGDDAIQVNDADDDGIFINNSGGDGIHVNNAGGWSANIQGDKNGDGAMPSSYVAHLYNRANEGSADVLALRVGQTSGVGDASHFIGFFEGDNQLIGRVEGFNGGVFYGTSNGDFAECLERNSENDIFLAGEIVGVRDGKVSHQIHSADQVMVITDQAAVLGNMPETDSEGNPGYERVSFIGQVPTRVRGPVYSGDWIVPSGNDDGIGIAISTRELTLNHQVVGQAWESSTDPGVKRINTAVGLDQSEVLKHIIRSQQSQIDELRSMMIEIKSDMTNVAGQ